MNLRWKRTKELAQVFCKMVQEEGFGQTMSRAAGFAKRRLKSKKGRFLPSSQVLERQRAADTSAFPIISICVPLYNTPMPFLKEMVESVLAQSCPRWELCLADASNDGNNERRQYLESLGDSRIHYSKIDNSGIAANTNEAARLASGSYLALLDHDDVLSPNAIFEMGKAIAESGALFLYSDEALFFTSIKKAHVGHFKPDFAPDYLNCCNYICHLAVFQTDLFWQAGGLNPACDGSQDHDLFLRLSEKTMPVHIPKVLYFWRVHAASTASGTEAKPYVAQAAKRAIAAHLERIGAKGSVTDGLFPSTYKVEYAIEGDPLVSILIPNKDHVEDLSKLLTGLYEKTVGVRFEVIVIENNSTEKETLDYYDTIQKQHQNLRVVQYQGGFNFSAINNFGRTYANGEYLLLLNNDIEVIDGGWLKEMLSLCVQPGVGMVGAKLLYPDDTVQHAGVVTGLGGFAGHSHKYARKEASGYMFRLATVQNFSAVTAACLLCPAKVYDEVGGLDEAFQVAFNDVDFCLRVRDAGYRILYTPYAVLYHHESKSRGLDVKGEAKARFDRERARLEQKHTRQGLLCDPFYNPNLTLDREDFSENDVLPKE